MGVLCLSLFCCALLCVVEIRKRVKIILKSNRELVALILLTYECLVTINALRLFLMVLCVGLRCVIVVFPDHTPLLFKLGPSTKLSYAMGSLQW